MQFVELLVLVRRPVNRHNIDFTVGDVVAYYRGFQRLEVWGRYPVDSGVLS